MAPDFRPLNTMDRVLYAAHQVVRRSGYPGLLAQVHLWFDGPVDRPRLAAALEQLGIRFPVITARLVDEGERGLCGWRLQPDSVCRLVETPLASDDDDAVLRQAEQFLEMPAELATSDPLTFHLLHRPGGRDVLIAQYDHTLMDAISANQLMSELLRLSETEATSAGNAKPAPPNADTADPIQGYLSQFSRRDRFKAVANAVVQNVLKPRGRVASLAAEDRLAANPGPTRMVLKCVGADETNKIKARLRSTPGLPSISMALLASAFRAIARVSPRGGSSGQIYRSAVGLDLRRSREPRVENFMSQLVVSAKTEELVDRDALVKHLTGQLRRQLRDGADLGTLQLTALAARRPKLLQRRVARMFGSKSINFAFFEPLLASDAILAGAPVERAFHIGLCVTPPGLGLVAVPIGPRLMLAMPHAPAAIPEELADRFLDAVMDDLV